MIYVDCKNKRDFNEALSIISFYGLNSKNMAGYKDGVPNIFLFDLSSNNVTLIQNELGASRVRNSHKLVFIRELEDKVSEKSRNL